jgi:hypothetical protein
MRFDGELWVSWEREGRTAANKWAGYHSDGQMDQNWPVAQMVHGPHVIIGLGLQMVAQKTVVLRFGWLKKKNCWPKNCRVNRWYVATTLGPEDVWQSHDFSKSAVNRDYKI